MKPTPFDDLNSVLAELVARVRGVIGRKMVGAYLQGSFAVGGFDRDSDVDWIVAIEDELAADEVEALQAVHGAVYELPIGWAQHLEGSYFPQAMLRDWRRSGAPLWYLDNGSRALVRETHDNTVVVRWQMREHGVPLGAAFPDPAALVNPIPVRALRQEIAAGIERWGRQILADPEPIANRFYQGFVVLHYCRAVHDLVEGRCGSKRAGAEWAKAALDPRWAGLIDRTWATRPDPAVSVRTPADPADLRLTLEFVEYMLEVARQYAARLLAE